MKIIGIDPGINGALCSININDNTTITHIIVMPIIKEIIRKKKVKRLDIDKIIEFIKGSDIVVLEKVHTMPNQGISSNGKFMETFGTLIGISRTLYNNKLGGKLILVSPQVWKRALLGPGKHEKIDSINLALKYIDKGILIPTKRSVKPHDGMAEAFLLTKYYLDVYSK